MRIVMATALASALLFAVAQTAHAAPLLNLKDGAQSPAGMVDLVRKGGGGGGGKGFKGGGGGGKAFRGGGLSSKSFKGGRSYSGRSYAGKSYKGGKSYGNRSRGGGNYAYRNYGKDNYGKYAHRGNKGRYSYYRRGYPYFWGGLALSGAYGYGSNCGWLYRQAQATGNAYWWQRYQDCVYYY